MRRQLVVLLLACALVLVAFAARASAPIDRPRYARGDFWTYRRTLEQSFGFIFAGNTTFTAGDVKTVSVQGEDVRALELAITGGGRFNGSVEPFGRVAGSFTLTGSDDWETGAWKSVRSFVHLIAEGTLEGGPAPLRFTLDVVNETTHRITTDTFPWPIVEGSQGAASGHLNASQNVTVAFEGSPPESNLTWANGTFVTSFEDLRTEGITVPAGRFQAHVIREGTSGGPYRLRWLAPEAGMDVRQEEYNETGSRVATAELTEFRYAAGRPAPPFPWLTVLVASLAAVALALVVVLALRRRRKPVEVWMPPAPSSPQEPKGLS